MLCKYSTQSQCFLPLLGFYFRANFFGDTPNAAGDVSQSALFSPFATSSKWIPDFKTIKRLFFVHDARDQESAIPIMDKNCLPVRIAISLDEPLRSNSSIIHLMIYNL